MIINEEFFGQVVNGTNKAEQFDIIIGSSDEICVIADDIDTNNTSIVINAAAGNDTINVHNGNNNIIDAGSGNDTINIQGGSNNTVRGGAGNDTFNIWWKNDMELTIDQSGAASKDNDKVTIYDASSSDFTMSINGNDVVLKNKNGGTINLTNLNVAGVNQVFFDKDGKNYILNTNGSNTKLNGRSDAMDEVYVMGGSKNTVSTYDGNDSININGGSTHTVKAGNGNDSIIINSGSSHKVYGENGNDYIEVNSGSYHQIYGGNDNDTIVINSISDGMTIKGENGDDKIYVNAGSNNKIYGGNGNDYIEVKSNSNKIYGENGDDTIVISGSSNIVDSGKNDDTIILLGGSNNNIKTGDGNDRVEMDLVSSNTIDTGKNNDIIGDISGAYNNIKTGDGNDVIGAILGNNNIIDTGKHNDIIGDISGAYNNIKTSDGDDVVGAILGNNNTIDTGKNNDRIAGVSGSNNNIKTGDGNDVIACLDGNSNIIDMGKGNDSIIIASGSWNDIKTVDGNDVVELHSGNNNVIDAGKGNDTVTVNGGEYNTIKTSDGNDTVYINGGNNNVYYTGKGADKVVINGGNNNHVFTENDKDNVTVNGGNNSIDTGAANDYIQLNNGDNTVNGGAGNDTFDINGGENYVYGDAGNDIFNINDSAYVQGGAGSDTYNVRWNNNLNLTIDQSGNGSKDKDILKITNLNSTDAKFSLNENNDIVISGNNGGQAVIKSYGATIFNYVQFANGVKLNSQQLKAEADKALNMSVCFNASGNSDINLADNVSEVKLVNTKASDVSYTYDYYQNTMIISNNNGATLTIKNWSNVSSVGFKFVDGYKNANDIVALATYKYSFGGNDAEVAGTNKADIFSISGSNNQVLGGAGNDVINVSGTKHTISGGTGSDVYNITWTLGSTIVINNGEHNNGDADVLNILNYGNGTFTKSYDEATGVFTLTDEKGGKLIINGWNDNSMEVSFKGEKFSSSQLNEMAKPKIDIPQLGNPSIPGLDIPGLLGTIKPDDSSKTDFTENVLHISDKNEEAVAPIEIAQTINGTDGNDVFDIVASSKDAIKVVGGLGKDTYNITWTNGAHVVIDQTSNTYEVDEDVININGLNLKDAVLYYDDNNDTLCINDKFGGSIDIVGWSTNYVFNTKFDDAKVKFDEVYNNMWYTYQPQSDTGSINIGDKVFVDFECNRDRDFTISTDDQGFGQVVVNMTKVNGIVNYAYNFTKTDFGITLVNDMGSKNETVVVLNLANIANSGIESLNIGSEKSFYFVKNGEVDFTSKKMSAENEIIFTGINISKLDIPKWKVNVNAGAATLNFNQVQMLAGNMIKVDSKGNLVNVKTAASINGVKNGNDLILTYTDVYGTSNRKVGEVTLKDFYSNSVDQYVYIGRTCENSDYSKLKLAVGTEGNDTVNLNQFSGNIMYLAGAGNDTIVAKTGSYILAQDGDDNVVSLGNYVDILGGAGDDTINLGVENNTEVSYNMVDAGVGNDIVSVNGHHNGVRAGAGDDTIVINSGEYNTVYSEDGKDNILIKNGSNNTVYAGNDDDVLTLNNGTNNRLYGDYGNDTLVINGGSSNQVYGGEGNDYLEVNGGNANRLNGSAGDDTIVINGGDRHYAYGDGGCDTIIINGGESNYAYGKNDNDCIKIYGGNKNCAFGDNGNDEIYVYGGNNHSVNGGAGDDMIYINGGSENKVGAVTANGGDGNDTFVVKSTAQGIQLTGGLGSDIYDIDWTFGHKLTVNNGDYATGDKDVLKLNANASDFMMSYNASTGVLELTDKANGVVRIEGYSKNPLEIKCNNETLDTSSVTKMMRSLNAASYDFAGVGVNCSDIEVRDSFSSNSQVNYVFGGAQ